MDTSWLFMVLGVVCLHLHHVSTEEDERVYISSDNGAYVKEVETVPARIKSEFNGQSCNRHFTTLQGTLTTPNYPSNYYDNAACSYTIDLSHEDISSIGFQFNDFDLEGCCDYLHYGEGVTINSRTLGSFGGGDSTPDILVDGDQVWFYFTTDYSVTRRGFSISWMGLAVDWESTTAAIPESTTDEATTPDITTIDRTTVESTTTEESPVEPTPVGTVGTEFVLLFMPDYQANSPTLMLSTPSLAQVQVDIRVPSINYHHSTTISRNYGQNVGLPSSVILPVGIGNKAVLVEADSGITVQAMIFNSDTGDGYLAIPTMGLGLSYVIASYYPYVSYGYPSHFAISSLDSETDIDITTNTGQSSRITLPPYHSYYMRDYDYDLTGYRIKADKPVAVFAGAQCSVVPTNVAACDLLAEQMLPLENLGKKFHIAPFPSRRSSGYIYRVIATNPDHTTHVSITGGIEVELEVGEFFEGNAGGYDITTIETDYSVITVQYMKGYSSGDGTGDPAMLLIPPYDMFSHNVTFSVYGVSDFDYYHASVTLLCEDTSGLSLDDSLAIDNNWYRLGNAGVCALQGRITPGVHTIGHTNPNAKFYVAISAVGYRESYIYSAGFNLRTDFSPEPTPPTTGVDCTGDLLTVYIPRSLIGSVDGSHLHFLNESCVGTNHNSSHVELSTGFDACGTMMEVQEDYIILSNVVQDVIVKDPSQVISRDDMIEIPVECRMEKDGLSSLSFHPDISKISYSEHGYGKFSFNLQLYEDGSYVLPYPPEAYPVDIHIRDMLYFEAQASARQGLGLFVKDCVATTTEDPTSTPQYGILQEGCPSDDTLQFFASGDVMIRHFGFEAFFFVDSITPVYVHCNLMLCNVTDTNSRCAQGCIAKSDVMKRSVDHTGSKPYMMTRGPFHFQEEPTNSVDSGYQSNTTFNSDHLAILVSSIGFLILCVTVSAAILKRLRKQNDYVLVNTSDEEQ